jgi:ribosomal protein S4
MGLQQRWFLIKKFGRRVKFGWYYNNLGQRRLLRYPYHIQTTKRAPYRLFSQFWINYKQRPWLDFVQSKRRVYTGFLTHSRKEQKWTRKFTWLPYLRDKLPWRQKKNLLYKRHHFLVGDLERRGVTLRRKFARVQQILRKIILPFYGQRKQKNLTRLKRFRKKSLIWSREDFIFSTLERRLDVMVYRLNLAPTIFWARSLIESGFISIISSQGSHLIAPLKKVIYPLPLRDPNSLYKKTLWKPFRRLTKREFFVQPITQIKKLVSPGDIIQCTPSALFFHQFKIQQYLWQKVLPQNILSLSNLSNFFEISQIESGAHKQKVSNLSNPYISNTILASMIFPPTVKDYRQNDRTYSKFLQWICA